MSIFVDLNSPSRFADYKFKPQESRKEARETIEKQTAEFLQNGGEITRVEREKTGFVPVPYIVINSRKAESMGVSLKIRSRKMADRRRKDAARRNKN